MHYLLTCLTFAFMTDELPSLNDQYRYSVLCVLSCFDWNHCTISITGINYYMFKSLFICDHISIHFFEVCIFCGLINFSV